MKTLVDVIGRLLFAFAWYTTMLRCWRLNLGARVCNKVSSAIGVAASFVGRGADWFITENKKALDDLAALHVLHEKAVRLAIDEANRK